MGATIQRTRYSKKSKKILQDDSVAGPEDEITTISGLNILTNGQVRNLLLFSWELPNCITDKLAFICDHFPINCNSCVKIKKYHYIRYYPFLPFIIPVQKLFLPPELIRCFIASQSGIRPICTGVWLAQHVRYVQLLLLGQLSDLSIAVSSKRLRNWRLEWIMEPGATTVNSVECQAPCSFTENSFERVSSFKQNAQFLWSKPGYNIGLHVCYQRWTKRTAPLSRIGLMRHRTVLQVSLDFYPFYPIASTPVRTSSSITTPGNNCI